MFINKAVLKFSSLLYKAHLYLDRRFRLKSGFTPYLVKVPPQIAEKKIIHINGNFIIGGTSQLIVDIIENTSAEYTHQIIAAYHGDPLPYQPVNIRLFDGEALMALHDHLEKEKPDLVHIHYWVRYIHRHDGIAMWYQQIFRICEELNIKVIQNVNVPTSPFISAAVKHNVFVSHFVRNNFNNADIPSSVIYPGSNFSHFQNDVVTASDTIGMVYRLDSDKLNKEAIEVFIAVVKRRPSIHVYIVGDGQFFKHYSQRVKEERITKNFTFTGYVSYQQLPEYYKKIGVFVTPVHDESFGQVTPFAMSMGLCVAGYDTGALKEILGSGDTLAEFGQIAQLTDLIIRLIDNRAKRITLGEQNKLRAHRYFSVETMIDQYKALYSACLNS